MMIDARVHSAGHEADADREADPEPGLRPIVIVDQRILIRQCLLTAFQAAEPTTPFVATADLAPWMQERGDHGAALVLLCLPSGLTLEGERARIAQALSDLAPLAKRPPLAVLSDREVPAHIIEVIRLGARGYIPTSASVEVTLRALQLVQAGDTYVPASSLCALLGNPQPTSEQPPANEIALFPPRQLSVARALRKGTPNKVIAYELNMCESTVKVHVRSIMKKLKARNRTEVAFLINQHFNAEERV